MRKTRKKTFSRKSRITSLILALLLTISAASVGFATFASAIVYDDSGGLAATGAAGKVNVEASTYNDSDKAFWVDAQYFDYYSDEEYVNGWLNPKEAGTNYDGADDDWYTFETFNKKISDYAKQNDVRMTYPLYFGNFCNTVSQKTSGSDTYIDSAYAFTIDTVGDERQTRIVKDHGGPYARVIDGLYHYQYFIENSNGLTDRHDSVMGLSDSKLNGSGDITTPAANGSVVMPYFSKSWLDSRNAATTVDSYFPFRQTTNGDVTTYSFDSTGAKDNVFFNWKDGAPDTVAYGQGKDSASILKYGVKDGLKKFMGDQDAGYGIFPFNRADNGNGGNNKLDYGFGIKMNMDFRVPQYGTTDGKPYDQARDNAIKFNYSGDDDIWVYITPYKDDGSLDYSKSYLALDLGGNHKMAAGNINFATMKSIATTEAAFAGSNVTYKSDSIYIALSEGWSDVNVWAWDDGLEGIWVNKTKTSLKQDGRDVYEFKLSDFGGRMKFTTTENTSWTGKRAKNEGKNLNSVIHGQLGNVCWSDNPNWIEPKYPDNGNYTNLAGVQYATTAQKTKVLNSGALLDPDKTYHMTIFYMERGMIESNCQMNFTMTPVKNDFKVNKTVNVSGVNTGLRQAIQRLNFDFTTEENGAVCKSIKDANGHTVNAQTGVYQLRHGETADFANQHETGSTLKVSERTPAGLRYSTEWAVVDNSNNGAVIKLNNGATASGSSLSTGEFKLENTKNTSAPANLQANFVNTPTVADVELGKKVVSEKPDSAGEDWDDFLVDDRTLTDDFAFRIRVNLSGAAWSAASDSQFAAYPLAYTITRNSQTISGTATNGEFTMRAGDTLKFSGMPIGATYTIEEAGCDGYTPVAYSQNGNEEQLFVGDASVYGTVGNNDDVWTFYNLQGVASKPFAVEKVLRSNGKTTPYQNGNLFTFRVNGLGAETYASGMTSVDATAQTKKNGKDYIEVNEINDQGKAIFANSGDDDPFLQFHRAGVYLFEVTESAVGGNKIYQDAISKSSQRFLVKFTIESTGDGLKPADNTPEYFTYDGKGISPATFADANKVDIPTFINEVKTGSITIHKKDGANSALSGVKFKLYLKDGSTETELAELATGADGVASYSGLDIYRKNGGSFIDKPAYQEYVLKETQTKNGHYQEKTIYTFTFPKEDAATGELKYAYTFDYVNGAIKNPQTGVFDVFGHMPLGVALIFLSFVSVGLYLALLRKKQLAKVHHQPRFF